MQRNLVFTRMKSSLKLSYQTPAVWTNSLRKHTGPFPPHVRCYIQRDWAAPHLRVKQLLEQITVHSQRSKQALSTQHEAAFVVVQSSLEK